MINKAENQMIKYQRILKAITDASSTALPDGVSPEQLERNIQPNIVYGVRCKDKDEYYRSVYLKPNPFTSHLQVMYSKPVYGDIPPGMPEASPEAVLKRVRGLNQQALNAFPYHNNGGRY